MIRSKFYNHFKKKCILCESNLKVSFYHKNKNFAPYKCFNCKKCNFDFWLYCDSPNYEKYCWWDGGYNLFKIEMNDIGIIIITKDFSEYFLEIEVCNKFQYINFPTIKELYDFDISKYFKKIHDNLVFI